MPIDASTPWHNDPSVDQCDVVKIETPERLEAVRIAIEQASATRDISKLHATPSCSGSHHSHENATQPSSTIDEHVVALADRT